jgi:hypothetical protein
MSAPHLSRLTRCTPVAAVLTVVALVITVAQPAAAQTSFSQPVAPPVASPTDAVTHGPTFRIGTAYMYLDRPGIRRSHTWVVKADHSGSLTITLQAGLDDTFPCCLGDGGAIITATVDQPGNPPIGFFDVTQPAFSPPAASASMTIATSPGAIYRVTLTSDGSPAPLGVYRLKFDGAEEALFPGGPFGSPHSVAGPFASPANGTRWVLNVNSPDPLNFTILPGGGPPAPCETPPCPTGIVGTEVTSSIRTT